MDDKINWKISGEEDRMLTNVVKAAIDSVYGLGSGAAPSNVSYHNAYTHSALTDDLHDFLKRAYLVNGIRSQIYKKPEVIAKVIFNDPATIVFWRDGTKTVVKATNEPYDPEKGLAMAFAKKFLGNKGCYYNIFKKWLPKQAGTETQTVEETVTDENGNETVVESVE